MADLFDAVAEAIAAKVAALVAPQLAPAVAALLLPQFKALSVEILTMSGSLESQLQAGLAAIAAANAQIAADLTALAGQLVPGNVLTQADIDAVNAAASAAQANQAAADALVNPPPPAP